MKEKKKFITPKMRVIKLEAEELLAGSGTPEPVSEPVTTTMDSGDYEDMTTGSKQGSWGR